MEPKERCPYELMVEEYYGTKLTDTDVKIEESEHGLVDFACFVAQKQSQELERAESLLTSAEQTRDSYMSRCIENSVQMERDKHTIATLNEQLLAVQSELERARGGKWVKVSDRLPEEHQRVLCYKIDVAIKCFGVCTFSGGKFRFDATLHLDAKKFEDISDKVVSGITHWQPLPPAPGV